MLNQSWSLPLRFSFFSFLLTGCSIAVAALAVPSLLKFSWSSTTSIAYNLFNA